MTMLDILEVGLQFGVAGLELAAALVIVAAAARALWGFASSWLRGIEVHETRLRFGRALLLALDFAIGADILRVAVVATLEAAAVAGLVVLVRVVLTFALVYELRASRSA